MKKILLAAAFVLCAFSVSAKDWAIGARVTGGVSVQAEYTLSSENYLEGRLGVGFIGGTGFDLTGLYQWNICNMDWTPKVGKWFFDAGVGASVGMGGKTLFAGVTGDAKLGIKFKKVPIKLALDYSPCIGLWFVGNRSLDEGVGAGFNGTRASGSNGGGIKLRNQGFFNFGLSCVYCF
ncbi:MAG: hypothetical protein IIW50_03375 [Alistipes sp.]|jgi:hypothetical protein|nr:hypothetical protein [Alistipes sp.]MBQ5854829.1 hypothetical protein [Alistipes sp.]